MKRFVCSGVLALGSVALCAATFTVTNTNDAGGGSLRQAIADANANPGNDLIHFNVTGAGCNVSGVCTIAPTSQLTDVNDTVTIDGYSQPGASPNTATFGSNAVLKIVLSAANIPNAAGISLTGAGVTVRGLVINGGFQWAVRVLVEGDVHVEGCFLGTDAAGLAALPNTHGVSFYLNGDGSVLGGPAPAQRNVIGSSTYGIDGNPRNVTIRNNLIGTDATGTVPLPQTFGGSGVSIACTGGGQVLDNVIAGFSGYGILSQCSAVIVIQGNHIGIDASGTVVFPPSLAYGMSPGIGAIVGGVNPGEGNVVTGMRRVGVLGDLFAGGTIRGNSIYGNGGDPSFAGLGIDMSGGHGPTKNDPGDTDGIQNFPLLKSATTGATTHVLAVLHSAASTTYDIDFYANPACTNFPRDFDEGQTYLGSAPVTTDGSGTAAIDVTLSVATATGTRISMTATNAATGRTSEFSQRLPFSVNPSSGPASGGTGILIAGTDFASGATVTMGGQPATGVNVSNSSTISATSPALAAGTVNDLVVTNTDGTSGTLFKGWASDFLDVPGSQPFNAFVTKLVLNAITAGCGGGNYCPNASVTRAQMAVFLLRGKNGLCYLPPPATGTVFNDVPANGFAAAYIEALAAAQVTGGCGGGSYCPGDPVTRAQMAVFLLRTLGGPTYVPPPCVTPTFNDVPCSNGFARWIEELVRRGITAGCGNGNYCPTGSVTRGQMAVFISTTFALP